MESTLISFNSVLSFWYDDYCFIFKFNGKKFVKKKKEPWLFYTKWRKSSYVMLMHGFSIPASFSYPFLCFRSLRGRKAWKQRYSSFRKCHKIIINVSALNKIASFSRKVNLVRIKLYGVSEVWLFFSTAPKICWFYLIYHLLSYIVLYSFIYLFIILNFDAIVIF